MLVVALSFVCTTGPASAASVEERKRSLDRRIEQLRERMEGTSAAYARAAEAVLRADDALAGARSAAAAADAEVAEARARDAALAQQLAFVQAQERKALARLDARTREQTVLRREIARYAREQYMAGGRGTDALGVLLGSGGPDEIAQRDAVRQAATRSKASVLAAAEVRRAEIRRLAARAGALREQAEVVRGQAAEQLALTREAQRRAAEAVAVQQRALEHHRGLVADLAARRDAERRRLDDMQTLQKKLSAELARRARAWARTHRSTGTSAPSGGLLARPVDAPTTSAFGMRYHPVLHVWRLHTGLDFGAACGSSVRAAADGRVVQAGWSGGYGYRVAVEHSTSVGHVVTTYNHLSRILVRHGAVRRGQVIARSGTTGLSTGCHLHFETMVNGAYRDPADYL